MTIGSAPVKHLIVALYNEEYGWIDKVPESWQVFVYHKGFQKLKFQRANYIRLPNCGRESHTYFTHVVKNYDNLADLSIFIQGGYKDHTPNLFKYLAKNDIEDITTDSPLSLPELGFVSLGQYWVHDAAHNRRDFDALIRRYCLRLWMLTHGNTNYPRYTGAGWGNHFAITKQLLRKFPVQWYEKIRYDHTLEEYYAAPWALEQYLPELFLDIDSKNEFVSKLHA